MAFYLKRPGQRKGEPIGQPGEWESPGGIDADECDWALYLPHQCDAWDIMYGTREIVLEAARKFRAELDEAIRRLEQAEGGS